MKKLAVVTCILACAGLVVLGLAGCIVEKKNPMEPGINVGPSGSVSAMPSGKKGQFDPLTLTCVLKTQHTIFIKVTAGPSGAPAGFSIQWVRHSDFPNLTCGATGEGDLWPASSDTTLCKGSFSGTPWCSIYNLGPNQSVTVEIGNLNDSECGVGLSHCGADELDCGTEYVFRAFAHADKNKQRSAFSANLCCSTEDCVEGCVRTQGYWKTHPCDWPSPFVPGANGTAPLGQCALTKNPNQQCAADQVKTFLIGSISYSQQDLLCNLANPGAGNALVILSHQLIAAELNLLNGATAPQEVLDAIAQAHVLINGLDINNGFVAPGGKNNTLGPAMLALSFTLDLYNNGHGGVPHCP